MIKRIHWYLPLLLILVGCVYCLGLYGPLLFDDSVNLEPLRRVESHVISWYTVVFSNPSSSVGRPVSLLSFFLNYWLFGFSTVAFKATNIALHLGIGAAVYTFIRRLLRQTGYCEHRDRIALVVAGCWLLSPLFVSTVLYVVQRMAMLSTLFTLLALSSYLVLRESFEQGLIRWGYFFLFCVYTLLGVFSKENAVLIPVYLLVVELFFCAPIQNQRGRQLRKWAIVVLAVLPLIATSALITVKSAIFFDYSARNFNIAERLLTEARVVWSYVGSLLVPHSSDFGLFHDDIQISRGLLDPATTSLAVLAWIAITVAIFYLRKVHVWRPMAGCVALFMAGQLLESTVFPLEIYFEHRNYLPGAALYLLLALAGENAIKNNVISLGAAKLAICAYFAVFIIALSQRVLVWSRYETIVYSSYQAHPNSPRAIVEAASQDAQHGKIDDALKKLSYARQEKLIPALGANIQTIWTYCGLNQTGLDDNKIHQFFDEVAIDGSPYTTIAMRQFNDLIADRPCANVPYTLAATLLADRLIRYYESAEYKQPNVVTVSSVDTLKTRTLEALNLTGQDQKTLELVAAVRRAGRAGVDSDLLEAAALIHVDKLDEAALLLEKLKSDTSLDAKMEADHIATLEMVLRDQLKRKEAHVEG